MAFQESDYQHASSVLECEVAMVKAFARVESSGDTWWDIDGVHKPPIRHEAHWFSKFTNHQYDVSHPQISSRNWNPAIAASTQKGAYEQHEEAVSLDEQAGLKSASYGAFQIMGFNYADLGYTDIYDFVANMQTAEGQMDGFIRFIQHNNLTNAMQSKDYRTLAAVYNGPGAVDIYAPKLEAAYDHFNV